MTERASTDRALELQGKIREGLRRLPEKFRCRHRRFLVSAQAPDGGFAGRDGGTDLYYTHFSLRAADVLGLDGPEEFWTDAAGFVDGIDRPPADVVDCHCEAFSRALLAEKGYHTRGKGRTSELAEVCRQRLPGREQGNEAGSLYRAFLAFMALQLLGGSPPAEEVSQFVLERRCGDGGYGDTPDADRGSLNPTAAAVLLLSGCGMTDEAAAAGEFLARLQRSDGGFPAHRDAPGSDLMSTFTALVALEEVGQLCRVELGDTARFARGLVAGNGGFFGAPADREVDVEYSYYGLGVMGLLSYCARVANC
ncbi:MAG: prenyltransferase/squalene oxidase repeat-containing protein [Planctomycetota bacterium]